MRVVRNILAASGVIGSLFASAGVKEVLLPERYVQGDVSAVRKIESAAFENFLIWRLSCRLKFGLMISPPIQQIISTMPS